jgi:hypothetical protein
MSTEIDPPEDVETLFAKVDIAMGWAEDHTYKWRGGPPRQMGEARQALRQAWARLCPDAQHEQITVSAFNVINSRFDAVDNDRPVAADVIAAHNIALDLLTPRT